MRILIPTYGRHDRQITLWGLPQKYREQTELIVQEREAHLYDTVARKLVLPNSIRDIGSTRQWITQNIPDSKVIQLDDDLVFARRRTDDPSKFRSITESDFDDMFQFIEEALEDYAHVGVAAREGGNRNVDLFTYNTRMMRVLAYRLDVLRKENIRHDRLTDVEDFDANLQLLRKGYDNCVVNSFCHNQGGSGTDGGCSVYRTDESHSRNVRQLAELHAPFVKVVQKTTKTSWGGKTRDDVIIRWKAARESAGSSRILD